METQLLRDQEIFPSEAVLKQTLGSSYSAFEGLMKAVSDTGYGIVPQWNYYKDGRAWLCKACYKKKTVFWLSVWDKFFKTSFFFTEKNCRGIGDLDIDNGLKENFNCSKPVGKLIPFVISINSEEQLMDVLKIIDYKKSLK